MAIDAKQAFGSDEPPLRGLRLSQTLAGNSQKLPHQSVNRIAQNQLTNRNIPLSQIQSSSSDLSSSPTLANPPFPTYSSGFLATERQVVAEPRSGALWYRVQAQLQRSLADQVTPVRLAGHLSVLAVAAVILILSQVEIPNWDISLRAFPVSGLSNADSLAVAGGGDTRVHQLLTGQGAGAAALSGSSLQRAIVPFTIIPEKPQEGMQAYTVQPGDTVLGIAERFGLKPESVQWANPNLELNPDLLRVGDQLEILPVDGALHRVLANETLSAIAAKYKVSVGDIVAFGANGLADSASPISLGTNLIIPGGVKPYVAPQVFAYNGSVPGSATKGSGAFAWPTSGSITQRFWSGHKAIDIGSWTGAPVKAADSGHVIEARYGSYNNGYGNSVLIDHGNGFVSLYAHLNSIYVRQGENIARGQSIGTVGNTGNSTGPHLHLEIRYQGAGRNPLSYLGQ